MNKKRVLSVLSAAVLAAGMLAGCGSSSSSSSSSSTAAATDAAATTEAAAATTEAAATDTAASGTVENKDKPVCWFNRQPSNSSTGELDMTALNFNKDTYYVGFDANQGAELQGQMVEQYIEDHADTIDRNGDGAIGYVLAIGDIGHNDSIARTRGVRKALQTACRPLWRMAETSMRTRSEPTPTAPQRMSRMAHSPSAARPTPSVSSPPRR